MHRLMLLCITATLSIAFAFVPKVVAGSDKLDVEAAEKLDVLKKHLPSMLEDWNKHNYFFGDDKHITKLRFIRCTSPTTAKLTFVLEYKEEADRNSRQIVSIYLQYYDGAWTTTSKEVEWETSNPENANRRLHHLMLLIDEFGQK
jgi:hypothetical protein